MGKPSSAAPTNPGTGAIPLPYQLAKASWVAPLLVAGLVFFLRGAPPGDAAGSRVIVVAMVATVLYLMGLVCGVAALFGIPKLGWRRILIPAIIGICLNGTILAFLVRLLFTGGGS